MADLTSMATLVIRAASIRHRASREVNACLTTEVTEDTEKPTIVLCVLRDLCGSIELYECQSGRTGSVQFVKRRTLISQTSLVDAVTTKIERNKRGLRSVDASFKRGIPCFRRHPITLVLDAGPRHAARRGQTLKASFQRMSMRWNDALRV
jgi:hypothetical protein